MCQTMSIVMTMTVVMSTVIVKGVFTLLPDDIVIVTVIVTHFLKCIVIVIVTSHQKTIVLAIDEYGCI